MELTKEIGFDTNSMPPKNMIWYRGKGKFYEWRNDVGVVAYDLGNTPSQEELNDIAEVIESKTGEELQDKSLSGILNGILELLPEPTPNLVYEINGEFVQGKMVLTPEQGYSANSSVILIVNGSLYPRINSLTNDQINALKLAAQIEGSIYDVYGSIIWEDNTPDSASVMLYGPDGDGFALFSYEM